MTIRARWDAVVTATKGSPRELRWLIALLVGLFLVSVIGLVFFRNVNRETLGFEIAKTLLQFGVVGVIGTLLTLLMFEYQRQSQGLDKERERERELLRLREELLKLILSRTTEAYSTVKRARRLLRAQAIDWGDAAGLLTRREPYDRYLEMISDAQLELVNLAREIATSKREFSDPTGLRKKLSRMKSYLGKLIGEYERSHSTFTTLPLADLPLLKDLTVFSKVSNFKKQFDDPFHGIQRSMRGDLLHLSVQPPCLGLREAHGDVVDRSPDAAPATKLSTASR